MSVSDPAYAPATTMDNRVTGNRWAPASTTPTGSTS